VTFILVIVLQMGGSALLWFGHAAAADPISFVKALRATYFLLAGQPVLGPADSWLLLAVDALLPVLGLAVVADGLVRFGYLFFAKQRNDKEWIAVQADAFRGHVVLCGAGRVGFRILDQLRRLGQDVVVVERNEQAAFVQAIRALGIPLLVEDVRESVALEMTNIRGARAIVCATDDDLVNLNLALDARRFNPKIHVVMRLFDDDLVAKVREAFHVEAFSTSALAAPAFAAAALGCQIRSSYLLDGVSMIVGELPVDARLAGRTVAQLHDEERITVLRRRAGSDGVFAPVHTGDRLQPGEQVLVQCSLADLETFLGECRAG